MSEITPQGQINLDSLAPLFERADREGLWFTCTYQSLWFSPAELRAQHAKGSFLWDARNWSLCNPQDLVTQLQSRADAAREEVAKLKLRIAKGSQT